MEIIEEVKEGKINYYCDDNKWLASVVVINGEVYLDQISNENFVKYILLGERD